MHVHSANRARDGFGDGFEVSEIVRRGVPDERGARHALGVSDLDG